MRVPPSAWMTSQSTITCRSPSFFRSTTARKDRPIRRWISWVRPDCLPLAASRLPRVWVARGSIPYSAVTQPWPLPRRNGGTFSSTEAVTSTRVSPKLTRHAPSACLVKPGSKRSSRIWSGARPDGAHSGSLLILVRALPRPARVPILDAAAMSQPIIRAERPDAGDFRPGGRGLSRARAAGRVEDAGRQRQPVAGVDPRGDAGARGARAADPSAYVRRAGADRDRAAAVRRRDHAGVGARRARAARDRAADRPRPADRGCARRGDVGAVGAEPGGGRGACAQAGAAAEAAQPGAAVGNAGAGGAGRDRRHGRESRRRRSRRGPARRRSTKSPISSMRG